MRWNGCFAWRAAANAQLDVCATLIQPAPSACTSSPWLIQARKRFGTPANSGERPVDDERGRAVLGAPRAFATVPPVSCSGGLEPVADAEQRHPERVDAGIGQRRLAAVAARRRAATG